jgi:hypothetical protein
VTKVFEDDLVLTEDTVFEESIKLEGDIRCENGRHDLKVKGNIDAWSIDAQDIDAQDIDVWNIRAQDIVAQNIDAGYIDAWNISFYAFCIAYRNIRCESIRGRRSNSIHSCLDSEIEYIEKNTVCEHCGQEIQQEEADSE